MFKSKEIKELENEIKELKSDADKKAWEHKKEIEQKNINITELEKKNSQITKNVELEAEIKAKKVTLELDKKIEELNIQNGTLKAENDILKSAFSNMGFEVKDMKEILNKLVDGIVSGNKVNIINANGKSN